MREVCIRTAAPSSIVVVEVEAPSRIFHVVSSRAEFHRLAEWHTSDRV
jgi:hypothetical protein